MKQCVKCLRLLPLKEFSFRNKRTGRRQTKCRECSKKYKNQHYVDNKAAYIEKQKETNRRYKIRNQNYIINYLIDKACVDCNTQDIRVLDFDHIDPNTKEFNIAIAATQNNYSIERIQKEIDKCEIRCANCHRIKTHPFGYRQRYLDQAVPIG